MARASSVSPGTSLSPVAYPLSRWPAAGRSAKGDEGRTMAQRLEVIIGMMRGRQRGAETTTGAKTREATTTVHTAF